MNAQLRPTTPEELRAYFVASAQRMVDRLRTAGASIELIAEAEADLAGLRAAAAEGLPA